MASTKEVLINTKIGGFHLKESAIRLFRMKTGVEFEYSSEFRGHPVLIAMFKKYGQRIADQKFCNLRIVGVPADIDMAIWQTDSGTELVFDLNHTWY